MRATVFQRLRYALTAAVVSVLVLLAIGLSLTRVLVHYAPSFRADAEILLSEALGRPLTLGGLRAHWVGRHPRLVLEKVRLQGPSGSGPVVDELEVAVDVLDSLRDWQLRLAEIAVAGVTVTARYGADGRLRLTKIGDVDIPESDGPLPELPAQLRLRDSRLILIDEAGGRDYRFPRLELRLDSDGGRYVVAGYAQLPEGWGRAARFRAEFTGLDQAPAALSGRAFVELKDAELAGPSPLLSRLTGAPPLAGNVDGALWLDFAAGRPAEARVDLHAENLRLRAGDDWRTVAAQLKGRARWTLEAGGWSLAANELVYVSDYRVWPKQDVSLRYRATQDGGTLAAHLRYLRLDDLAPVLAALPWLPEAARAKLAQANPRGELLGPVLTLAWNGQGVDDFRFATGMRGLGVSPVDHVPGFEGLSGRLQADRDGGLAQLDSKRGSLNFDHLFRTPLPFDSLRGQVGWRRDEGGWRVETDAVELHNADGRGLAQIRVFLDANWSPFLDVRAHVTDGNGASTSRYLPSGILPAEVVSWLDGAIKGGEVTEADVLMYGRAHDFPFEADASGVFDVRADIVNGRLDYFPGWPGIDAIGADLHFHGSRMDITARAGSILGAEVEEARVWIDNLNGGDLQFAGKVRGDGAQLLRFLRESPLGAPIRDELGMMTVGGQQELSLHAVVPFHHAPVRVDGKLAVRQGSFALPRWNIRLDGLQGEVAFNERGVQAQDVRGSFRGAPVRLRAVTEGPAGNGRIRISSPVQLEPRQLLGLENVPGVSGSALWQAEVVLPAFDVADGKGAVQVGLRSDLVGVEIALPEPVAKPADQARPFAVNLRVTDKGAAPVRVTYGDELKALLALDDRGERLRRVTVSFGPDEPVLREAPGAVITGSLRSLDLDAWRRVGLGATAPAPVVTAGTPAKPVKPAQPSADALAMRAVDLTVGRLHVVGQDFLGTRVRAVREADGWRIGLAGPDLAGLLQLPDNPEAPVVAELERLRLELPKESPDAAAPATASRGNVPPMQVKVAELLLGEHRVGQLELKISASPDGKRIDYARLKGPVLDVSAAGGWGGADGQSRLDLMLNSVNAGEALTVLGYADTIKGGVAEANLDIRWPGTPAEFTLAKVSGKIDLVMTNGQVLSVNPGAGRLFGLLSITALPRRLSFDFSDLFGEGFAFDRIESRLDLTSGDAYTRKFFMQGPAARVELDGRIGLGARDYDQEVTVMPHVGNALPAVGAITAGPVGALTAFLTQKLLEKPLSRLVQVRYQVTGSWDEPKIEPVANLAPELPKS